MPRLIDKFLRKTPSAGTAAPERRKSAEDLNGSDPSLRPPEEARLAGALRAFRSYNDAKAEFLYKQLSLKKKLVYDLVPYLIHRQADNLLPDPQACRQSLQGVYLFQEDDRLRQSFKQAFPGQDFFGEAQRASMDPSLPIKSISLIGSLGSVAQNSKSDFDYWICYDGSGLDRSSLTAFRRKLKAIEKWADETAGAEVHFFPLELRDVRVDNFGPAGSESSGSAQSRLLKEEFYRTMTLVAGQVPLWWVMPPGIDYPEYRRLARIVAASPSINPNELVDLGHVHDISLGEYYGAAIWQINKTIGSPFKSVLKMSLLEGYMFQHGGKSLLCDELKHYLLNREEEARLLDPYILMFFRAAEYLEEFDRKEDLDLLRRSLYLKIKPGLTLSDFRRRNLTRKKSIMAALVRSWNWGIKDVETLNNYHFWSFSESQAFSGQINRFIFRTYKNVSAELSKQKKVGAAISQRDLKVLSRKLSIFYTSRPNKIDSIKNVIEAPPTLTGLTIQPTRDEKGEVVWSSFRGMLSKERVARGGGEKLLLRQSRYLVELLIWLTNNRLYNTETSIILNSGSGPLVAHPTVPEIQNLLQLMISYFPRYRHSSIQDRVLLSKPILNRMLLVVNFEAPDRSSSLAQICAVYQNNWGEVFFQGFDDPDKGILFALEYLRELIDSDKLSIPDNFRVFLSERHRKRALGLRLNDLLRVDLRL